MSASIVVEELSKAFVIPHEQRTMFKEYFLHPFRGMSYERNEALRGLSFSVETGEFFGVIGANGSGKSTLLKIVAGIYRGDRGLVRVRGRVSPFIELGVGFNLELTARDNILINGTLLGLSPRELRRRFHDILEFAELGRFVDQKLKNFSSGMQLRLAYSISIQVPFDVLLLDEVLAVGDESFQEKCFKTFEQMRRDGKTVLFVSHDLDAVMKNCNRTLLLHNGVVDTIGPSEEVIARYRLLERRRESTPAA